MTLATKNNSNMLNLLVMFICHVLNWKYIFWANLVQKSNLSIFYHGVRRSQNQTGVKKVDLCDKHLKNVKYFCFTLYITRKI